MQIKELPTYFGQCFELLSLVFLFTQFSIFILNNRSHSWMNEPHWFRSKFLKPNKNLWFLWKDPAFVVTNKSFFQFTRFKTVLGFFFGLSNALFLFTWLNRHRWLFKPCVYCLYMLNVFFYMFNLMPLQKCALLIYVRLNIALNFPSFFSFLYFFDGHLFTRSRES